MVDARHLNGANVIMESNKAAALASYAQWLANAGVNANPSPTAKPATIQGKVTRISSALENGSTVYFFQVASPSRIFKAGLALSAKLPLVQPGDTITGQYLDTGQSVVTLTSFDDLNIQAIASTPGAAASP